MGSYSWPQLPQSYEDDFENKFRTNLEQWRQNNSTIDDEITVARGAKTDLKTRLDDDKASLEADINSLKSTDTAHDSRISTVEAFLESNSDFSANNPITLDGQRIKLFSATNIVDAFIYEPVKELRADTGESWIYSATTQSWYDEPGMPQGRFLGYFADEASARAAGGGTEDWYARTGSPQFFKLNSGSGETEIYRGHRKQFPERVLIVALTDRVIIYDLTEPNIPMWMVFIGSTTGNIIRTTSISSCDALNSNLLVGSNNGYRTGLMQVNFVLDVAFGYKKVSSYPASDYGKYLGDISNRNDGLYYDESSAVNGIVHNAVNDVAITVLPSAPIDSVTQLAVPTIAVATEGGVSVINGPAGIDTVVDWTYTLGTWYRAFSVDFIDSQRMVACFASPTVGYRKIVTFNIPISDGSGGTIYDATIGSIPGFIYDNTNNNFRVKSFKQSSICVGNDGSGGEGHPLQYLYENRKETTNGIVGYITQSWSSGLLPGDIRLASLADTTQEIITGSGELVTNGTFDTDIKGWTDASTGTGAFISHDATNLRLALTSDAVDTAKAQQAITTVSGEHYLLAVDVYDYAVTLNIGTTAGGSEIKSVSLSTGRNLVAFYATGTTTYLSFEYLSASGTTSAGIDNVTCKLAEPDRSVKDNGLHVIGSITKTPVATGAELVAYSGFSSSNYLEQPYNPDLDFGTGDFSFLFWHKQDDNGATPETIFERNSTGTSAQRITVQVDSSGYLTFTCDDNTTVRTATSSQVVDDGSWHLYCLTYSAGTLTIYRDGTSIGSATGTALATLSNSNAVLRVGEVINGTSYPNINGTNTLWRAMAYAPSEDQIRHIYETEKHWFQENAKITLQHDNNGIIDLAYDEVTNSIHAVTSSGITVFDADTLLVKDTIDSSTLPLISGTPNSVAAKEGIVAVNTSSEAIIDIPAVTVREELLDSKTKNSSPVPKLDQFTGDGSATDFTLSNMAKPGSVEVYVNGTLQRGGSSEDYTISNDGFKTIISFAVAPALDAEIDVKYLA